MDTVVYLRQKTSSTKSLMSTSTPEARGGGDPDGPVAADTGGVFACLPARGPVFAMATPLSYSMEPGWAFWQFWKFLGAGRAVSPPCNSPAVRGTSAPADPSRLGVAG